MEITEFEKEFVERTKEILSSYEGEYKLSNAIGCMLGLIVLPNENIDRSRNRIWDELVSEIKELEHLSIEVFEPIQGIGKKQQIRNYPKTLKILLKKLRNGFAHQNIEPINEDGIFTGIEVCNYYDTVLDLKISFSRRELERFAHFIADQYLAGYH